MTARPTPFTAPQTTSTKSKRSRQRVIWPSWTSKVPQTQNPMATGPTVRMSVRSVRTTGPLEATWS